MKLIGGKKFGPLILFFTISCLIYAPVLGKRARNPDAGIILPPLFSIESATDYLSMLGSFEVIDFQPVRDLSFFFDIALFKLTGVVTFAMTNVVLWSISIFFLFRLLERISEPSKRIGAFFWATAFAVYPLFSQAVCWGMARKHVLAFLLILWTTSAFLDWMEKTGSFLKTYIGYVLAGLSHPITLLWPIWAFAYHHMFADEELKPERRKFFLYLLTAVVLLFTNYAYYTVGNQKVAEVFGHIQPDLDPAKMALNFLFYFRQLILPYDLSFMNAASFERAWPGLIAVVALGVFCYLKRKNHGTLIWCLFALLPFPIVLTLNVVFDQYLLVPAAGLWLALFREFDRPSRTLHALLSVAAITWGTMTYLEAESWADPRKATLRNFMNAPSCKSASEVLVDHYSTGTKSPPTVLDYVYRNDCLRLREDAPMGLRIAYIFIESMVLYYERESFPYAQRIERLKELSALNYYPDLVLAAIYSEEGKSEEVESISRKVLGLTGDMELETGPVIDDVLRPYCLKHDLPACLRVTRPNSTRLPYL